MTWIGRDSRESIRVTLDEGDSNSGDMDPEMVTSCREEGLPVEWNPPNLSTKPYTYLQEVQGQRWGRD